MVSQSEQEGKVCVWVCVCVGGCGRGGKRGKERVVECVTGRKNRGRRKETTGGRRVRRGLSG